jgi:hypothetical protein
MYAPEEIEALGFAPYAVGQPVDGVVVQADHAEYATLTALDFPGVQAIVDGRRITDPAGWAGVRRIVLGAGDGAAQR